jgi:ankyrin repeat protein
MKGAYEIVQTLIAKVSNLDQINYLGETALHAVCKIDPYRLDIIELLLSSGCNSQILNFAGKTPLWVTQSSEVFKIFMRYSPADVCQRILSDDIDEEQSLELLHYLIQQYNWNPNDSTKNGDTALHLACKADRLTIVKYLFSIDAFKYDPYAKNKLNQTPIELTSSQDIIRELIKHGNPIDLLINPVMDEEQVLQLVKEIDKDKLNGTTANDNTALHLACLTDRTTVVRYLLRESKIDVNAKNVIDISPIQLTKYSEIIIELIRHGANPTDLYSYCRRILGESRLLQTTVKVFVLGDSNVGKSTLISSLKKEGWFNFFTSWSSTVSSVVDDAEPDHGIITHDFKSKQCGQITLYDFVGKRLFHESQSDLLRETAHSPRVFIVVINLSGSVEESISSLQYWLGFLEEISSVSEFKNHIIVAGSNIDKCRKDETRKTNIMKGFLQKRVDNNVSDVNFHDFIALDCRRHSSGISKLRRCLTKLCVIARNPKSLAFNAHCFQVYIMDRFKGKVAVSVREIVNKMREEEEGVDENDPLNFLPQSEFQLQNLCVELHNKSQIMCLRDPMINETDFESSWLIIDKAVLISKLFEAFESTMLPSNNGILSFSIMSDLEPFKIYNSDMFVRFLCHLEHCKEISDRETLQAITNSAHVNLTFERSFFFPVLVENSAPEGIWDDDADNFSYHCGWILQCANSEQFFTSKFLQTIILRVIFCNTYLGPSGASIPTFLNCSLWKGGISWGNICGAETLVEVLPDNKAIIFLMRCRDANVAKCMEHRATIIHQIRKCAKEFCGTLKTRESLIFPSLVKEYPICSTPSAKSLFDIEPLAFAIVNITSVEQPYASSQTGTNTIPIRDLLKFEPYFELSALIVQEICNINNPRYISCLTDDFLIRFAQQIRNNSLFIGMITQILYDHHIMDTNVDNLLSKLMKWRDTYHITYQQLHKCMDRFSIFTGLNIVVCLLMILLILINDTLMQDMVPGLAVEEFSTPPSSPVLATRTRRKTALPTTDSDEYKLDTDSSNKSHDIQLGE